MVYVIGVAAASLLLLLLVGAASGRLRLRGSCCAVADPSKDLRMRAAYETDEV